MRQVSSVSNVIAYRQTGRGSCMFRPAVGHAQLPIRCAISLGLNSRSMKLATHLSLELRSRMHGHFSPSWLCVSHYGKKT